MKAEEYLQTLTEQIRCKMARGAVREELCQHIEDQKAAFMSEGMSESEAEEAAVLEMGDPAETGQELDRIHRPKMPWGFIVWILVLSIGGFLLQCIWRSFVLENGGDDWVNTDRQLLYMTVGIGIMLGICFIDYTRIAERARELMLFFLVVIYIGRLTVGVAVNGSYSWLVIGGFSVNIAFLMQLTIPLYAAVLYRYRREGYAAVVKGILWILPGAMLMWVNTALSMTCVLVLTYLLILAAAVWKNWFCVKRKKVLTVLALFPTAGLAFIITYGAVWGTAYQRERIMNMLAAVTGAEHETGYTIMRVKEVLGGSQMVGQNLDMAEIAVTIPGEDYLLTGMIGTYGLFAGILIAGFILLLFLWFCHIALRQKNQLGMLMGFGCTVVLFLQAGIYVLSNLGMTSTVTWCPFITYGGTGSVVLYILLGLLLSICHYENTAPERKFMIQNHKRTKVIY